ncbi:MAG: penicillin-binding protein activator [Pseudomonadota bacterium]
MKRLIAACLLGGAALSACETTTSSPVVAERPDPYGVDEAPLPEGPIEAPAPRRIYDEDAYLTPPHMTSRAPVRVGLLLPFSAENEGVRKIAAALFDAAQLAVFDAGDDNLMLIPKDAKGTADGARRAAEGALEEGAEIILGPLFSDGVEAAADIVRAAEKQMIAFSSDLSVAGEGVYLLSFPPEAEIARVTDYAILNGYFSFALLAPRNDYGYRVGDAFAEEVYIRGAQLVAEERYEQDPQAMVEPAKRLARYNQRSAALRQERQALAAQGELEVAQRALDALENRETYGDVPYDAVLVPEQGNMLRALAPLLPYYDVDIRKVKLLGTSLWNNPALAREPALNGGWFAAPDPEASRAFRLRFAETFGYEAPRLASLAYDAGALAARLGREAPRSRFEPADVLDQNGFLGVDGVFRFTEDGRIERGLAILEIRPSGIRVIDPAPRSFLQVGF